MEESSIQCENYQSSIQCENYQCGKIIGDNDQIFTIPLDKDWEWKEGTYCSLVCTLYVNKNLMSLRRQLHDYKKREQWILENEQMKMNKSVKKKK